MAETPKTSDKAAGVVDSGVVFSMPLKVGVKRDVGTGDERKFAVEFASGAADGVHTLFVHGTIDGDTADRLELANEYVLEVRRA